MTARNRLISNILLSSLILSMLISINGSANEKSIELETANSLVFSIYPENNINSMGSVYTIIDDNDKVYRSTVTILQSGLDDNPYPSTMNYRGYAKFELSNFPSNVCIDSVIFEAITIKTIIDNPTYYAEIVRLNVDPAITYMDTILTHLNDSIRTGFIYDTSLQLAQVIGTNTVSLGAQGIVDLENALQKGWFAVGLDSFYHMMISGIVLRVYGNNLSVGPPSPTASNNAPCANENYTVSWNNINNATAYRLYENSNLIYNGTGTQYVFNHSSGAGYNYTLSYNTICGWSAQSEAETVNILTNSTVPFPPSSTDNNLCRGENFIISWDPIPGATIYRLYENDVQRYEGSSTYMGFTYASFSGTFNYKIQYGNSCGWSPMSGITTVNVINFPDAPDNLISSSSNPCPNQNYTMTWNSSLIADSYRLLENGIQIYEGANTFVILSHSSGGFTYQAIAGNSCGWSENSVPQSLSISETPATPLVPTASTITPCENTMYTISWTPVAGASEYWLFENDILIYEGFETSMQITNPPGGYSYHILAGNDCNQWSAQSNSLSIVVSNSLLAPDTLFSPWPTPCHKDSTLLIWSAVPNATKYYVYRDNIELTSTSDTTIWILIETENNVGFTIMADNHCGISEASMEIKILVGAQPQPPDTLYCLVESVEIDEKYTIAWDKTEFPAAYVLYENGVQIYSGRGSNISLSQEIHGDYSYTISVCSECNCSDTVANLLVVVKGSVSCCVGSTANIDNDQNDIVDISDLTFLIDYFFRQGVEPVCFEETDVTLDGKLDISDLTYIIAYFFQAGPAPPLCP